MCDVRDVIFGVRGSYFEIDIIIEINNIGPILELPLYKLQTTLSDIVT